MITKKVFKDRATWEAWRGAEFRIGGSNIGTILGLNPYCTPFRFWQEYRSGQSAEISQNNVSRGRFYEFAIAEWFQQESGCKIVKKSAEIAVYQNDELPDYFQASPDRECFAHGESARVGVEIKDTRKIIDFEKPETVPDEWFAQIQYYMGVLNRPFWYLAVNDGTKTLKFRRFAFDADYFAKMIKDASEWAGKYIFGDEIPPMSGADDVNAVYPSSVAGEKIVGNSVFELCEKLKKLNERQKEISAQIDEIKQQIIAQFDDRDTLVFEGARLATYKSQERETIDKKALIADLGDEAQKYIKKSNFRTLKI